MLILKITIAIIASALINLDRQYFGRFMINRPLPFGLIVGLLIGQAQIGAILGLWVELLWLNQIPLGGKITPNGGLAVAIILISILLMNTTVSSDFFKPDILVFSFFFIVPLAHFLKILEKINRRQANKINQNIIEKTDQNIDINFLNLHITSLFKIFLLNLFTVIFLATLFNFFLLAALYILPEDIFTKLGKIYKLMPILGLSIAIMWQQSKFIPFYLAGIGAGLLVLVSY